VLHDNLTIDQVVDSEAALEFMKEATKLASSAELEDIGQKLEQKAEFFSSVLTEETVEQMNEDDFRTLLGMIFSVKRKAGLLIKTNGFDSLRSEISELLHGTEPIAVRFTRFVESIDGIEEAMRINLASELLHYSNPKTYWLWTNWIWDSHRESGALRLVTQDDADHLGSNTGEVYLKVGKTTALVNAIGHSNGFSSSGKGLFGTDIFLACVYAVYMYTVIKLKLSQEFNRILPNLPELTQRVLGVYKFGVME